MVFAFHNAETLLNGLPDEDLTRISNQFYLEYDLGGKHERNKFNLDFDLSSVLPKRINVLIGRNGLGKSRALSEIVSSLLKGDGKFSDRNNTRPMISRVLAIATPGETSNTFPREPARSKIKYRRLILNRISQGKASRGFGELCVQLVRSNEYIADKSRWALFINSLSFLSDAGDLALPVISDISKRHQGLIYVKERSFVKLTELARGSEQAQLEIWNGIKNNASPVRVIDEKTYPLSSGEQAFIKFAVQASLFVENGTLVLLDEPETHLHPNLITDFVALLDALLEKTGSIAIIATHSAYFVREIPKTQVLVFKDDGDGSVYIQNPRLNTFGADVGTISYFVFEDGITSTLVNKLYEKNI